MVELTEFVTYRNDGIEFTAAGTSVDGRIGIVKLRGPYVEITCNGIELALGSEDYAEVERALDEWLGHRMTPQMETDLAELDAMDGWQNLPRRLDDAVLSYRVRTILERLKNQSAR